MMYFRLEVRIEELSNILPPKNPRSSLPPVAATRVIFKYFPVLFCLIVHVGFITTSSLIGRASLEGDFPS